MSEKKRVIMGKPVSTGIAIARAYLYEPAKMQVQETYFEECFLEERKERCRVVFEQAKEELQHLYDMIKKEDADKANIFQAHMELLEDEEILEEISMSLEEYLEPDYAIYKVFTEFAELLSKVEDTLIAGRVADLTDVRNRLIRIWYGKEEQTLSAFDTDVILIAHDLLPSDTASMDRRHVKGIITEIGGENSHTAILARSFGIPAMLGVSDAMEMISNEEMVVLDAVEGKIILSPDETEKEAANQKKDVFFKKKQEEATYLNKTCMTTDGKEIQIGINIGSSSVDTSSDCYDFVGLFRTEFLYMERNALPTEEEQFKVYRHILEQATGKPVTLRTLDIGGDKSLPYMDLPKEENPFLGKRALRYCLDRTDIFLTQLRAALRASVYGTLQIMFPMVTSMEDIRQAKEMVYQAMRQLDEQGLAYDSKVRLGIMIEVPSIALIADLAAQEVDFASIGSNDLTQYVCATDRMNSDITQYYQSFSPAMLRILGFVFDAFHKNHKEISVCGELAGNPDAARLLVGLGATKLSMNATSIAGVKAAISKDSAEELEKMATECKEYCTQEEIVKRFGI